MKATGHGPISEALRKLTSGRENDYYRELGKIQVNFARIEMGTVYILGLLSGMKPEVGFPIIGDMSSAIALKKLRKIVPITVADENTRKKIGIIAGKIDAVRETRNKLLHSIWYLIGRESGLRYDSKTQTRHSVTLKELDEFNTFLEVLLVDLVDLEKIVP
jgi:hypothetical protein